MNLKSVEGQSPNAVRAILARAVLAQMSETSEWIVPPGHRPDDDDTVVRSVVGEVRRELGVAQDDLSETARERVAERLDSILRELTITPERENDAKRRLGDRGELWPGAYRLNLNVSREKLKEVAVTRQQIEQVLKQPDAVQHLLPAAFDTPAAEPMSLYVKYIQGRENRPRYVMLVQTHRRGDEQLMDHAWRVFQDDLDVPMPESPLRILEAFIKRFGIVFSLGGNDQLQLFVPYAHLEPDAVGGVNLISIHGTPDRALRQGTQVLASLHAKRNEDKSVDVALAYTINLSEYQESLRRHRI